MTPEARAASGDERLDLHGMLDLVARHLERHLIQLERNRWARES